MTGTAKHFCRIEALPPRLMSTLIPFSTALAAISFDSFREATCTSTSRLRSAMISLARAANCTEGDINSIFDIMPPCYFNYTQYELSVYYIR